MKIKSNVLSATLISLKSLAAAALAACSSGDGNVMSISASRQSIVLASGLDANTDHTVTLMKEAYATSRLTFHGFSVTGSEILPPPPRPERRIAFFGDSNMEGYSFIVLKSVSGDIEFDNVRMSGIDK